MIPLSDMQIIETFSGAFFFGATAGLPYLVYLFFTGGIDWT